MHSKTRSALAIFQSKQSIDQTSLRMSDRTPTRTYTGLENLDHSPLPLSSLPTSPASGSGSSDGYFSSPPVTPLQYQHKLPIPENSSPVSSMIASSPIRGRTKQEKAASRAAKRQRQRSLRKQAKVQQKECATSSVATAQAKAEKRNQQVIKACVDTLLFMGTKDITFGDLIVYISDPKMKQGDSRWLGFFNIPGRVAEVLNYWVSTRNSQTGCLAVHNWALNYSASIVEQEGKAVTTSGLLRSEKKIVDKSYTADFSIGSLYTRIKSLAPAITRLMHAFSTTQRQREAEAKAGGEGPIQKKEKVCVGPLYIVLSVTNIICHSSLHVLL